LKNGGQTYQGFWDGEYFRLLAAISEIIKAKTLAFSL
jgi:hypothetical protein